MVQTTTKANSRRLLAKIMVTGSIAAMSMGLASATASASPPMTAAYQYDCDHTGRWSIQPDRGMPRWSDCARYGHWEWIGQWVWVVDWNPNWNNNWNPIAPPPLWSPPSTGSFG